MGDPAGIGPEVTRAGLAALASAADWVIYGPEALYPGVAARFEACDDAREAIERSADALARGAIDGVVTAPVSKACFGGDFPGHTELYAARTGTPHVVMMMAGPRLRAVPATTHLALRDVPGALSVELLVRTARIVARALATDFGVAAPRIAMAALNPHAGDGGLFGDEEARIVGPAVERLRAEGLDVSGPASPDTVYHQALSGRFDAVVAPYHDQALIPFKLVHFSDGVNVTLGLPRPRTSPDHGPAYDIAGRGVADPTSMIRAMTMAVEMASRQRAAATQDIELTGET
ncbi:MAG: 4-hydroxythreonine-4-phosphate dehydrogenase PdxA [Deltaproteobacteria bacterium]|nr:4-hydroxythreonine-4-phosphate dehydrogenase PdxA [Deltaproteobacteria bacterium]